MSPLPGWYPDPAAPETQRYWDGEQWIGAPLPTDVDPPPGAPPVAPPAPVVPTVVPAPGAPAVPSGSGSGSPAGGGWGRPVREAVADRPTETETEPAGGPAGHGAPSRPAVPPGHLRLSGSTVLIPIDQARLAPLGRRLVARLIDIAAVTVLCAIVSGYFWYRYAQAMRPVVVDILAGKTTFTIPPEANQLNEIILGLTIGLWFAYEVPAVANSGQTLGKRIMGIRVIRALDDEMLSFGQSFQRWAVLMLPSPATGTVYGLLLQLADLLWCTWDRPARQCLHDKAVASIVVRARTAPVPDQPPTSNLDVRRQ